MLGTEPRNAQTFVAGAILANGARLAEIHRDHVVLVKGDRRTSLYLEGADAPLERNSNANELAFVGGETSAARQPRLSSDPISDYLRAVPAYRDGLVVGMKVYPGKQSAAFHGWGLRAGDVIVSADGVPFVDAEQAMEVLRTLAFGATLSVAVSRNDGQRQTLSLEGADLLRLQTISTRGSFDAPMSP